MRISKRGRVSQADIAARAGLTQAAVSMILRGRAEGIPEATRDKVLRIAEELGYRADPLARRLAAGRSQILGVFTYERVFPVAQRNFYHPFLVGIEEGAEAHGQDLLLFTSTSSADAPRSLFGEGENKLRLVDAAVLLGRDELPAELEQLHTESYPFVFIGRRFLTDGTEVPSVSPDYARATAALGARLADSGHRRVTYIGSDSGLPASKDRISGMDSCGLDLTTVFTSIAAVDRSTVTALIREGTTAVVTENAEYAKAVVRATESDGGVSNEFSVAVAGLIEDVDEAGWSGFLIPGTSIGRQAVEDVIDRLEGGAGRPRRVPCPAVRGSSIRPAASAPTSRSRPQGARP